MCNRRRGREKTIATPPVHEFLSLHIPDDGLTITDVPILLAEVPSIAVSDRYELAPGVPLPESTIAYSYYSYSSIYLTRFST